MRLGNGLWEHTNFNSRLQTVQIGLGSTSSNSSYLRLDYGYGTTNNNGNLLSQTVTVPTVAGVTGFSATQTYTYDSLNRLATAKENNGSSWTQNFIYDRYGNRNFISGTTFPTSLTPPNNPAINPANNRIDDTVGGQTNVLYDGAGNLTREVSGHTYEYDAENKIISYDGGAGAGGGASYRYDADGRRVKKVVGGSPLRTTVFVYDITGRLVAEYSDAAPTGSGTSYLTGDTLGSPRVITGANQEILSRHDYLPFGEELTPTYGGRTEAQGYVIDNVRQKFTSKERDIETGLDYFGARYYSSQQGRFTGVDIAGPDLSNPQTLNKYAYTLNNPLRYIDRKGLYEEDVHLQLTYALGMAAGFTAPDAWNIALGNQGVDDDPHRGPFAGVDARRKYHFTTQEQRDNLWGDFVSAAGAYTGPSSSNVSALDSLGTFLHAQQDSY
jgi:RHS repeat-associated protein